MQPNLIEQFININDAVHNNSIKNIYENVSELDKIQMSCNDVAKYQFVTDNACMVQNNVNNNYVAAQNNNMVNNNYGIAQNNNIDNIHLFSRNNNIVNNNYGIVPNNGSVVIKNNNSFTNGVVNRAVNTGMALNNNSMNGVADCVMNRSINGGFNHIQNNNIHCSMNNGVMNGSMNNCVMNRVISGTMNGVMNRPINDGILNTNGGAYIVKNNGDGSLTNYYYTVPNSPNSPNSSNNIVSYVHNLRPYIAPNNNVYTLQTQSNPLQIESNYVNLNKNYVNSYQNQHNEHIGIQSVGNYNNYVQNKALPPINIYANNNDNNNNNNNNNQPSQPIKLFINGKLVYLNSFQ